MSRRVWTFRLAGGEPFDGVVGASMMFPVRVLHPGGNGTTTICSLRLTVEEAQQVEQVLASTGIRVSRWTVDETPEQRALRDHQRQELPTAKCPNCFWLDMEGLNPCGLRTWPEQAIVEALVAHDRAQVDADDCPLPPSRSRAAF